MKRFWGQVKKRFRKNTKAAPSRRNGAAGAMIAYLPNCFTFLSNIVSAWAGEAVRDTE
jgi:hypothetical protein